MQHTRKLIDRFEKIARQSTQSILGEAEQHALAERVQDNVEKTTTPLRRWENALETPVALFVMPVFALVNAGIAINQDVISNLWVNPLGLGIIFGLLVGKTVGISLFAWLSLRLGLGRLSDNVEMSHIIGIGLLGGMGFTMSIFISTLGFAGVPEMLVNAKAGILLASLIAGVCGFLWLRMLPSKVDQSGNS
jgi:NhaA family Na+:H+ antiporter